MPPPASRRASRGKLPHWIAGALARHLPAKQLRQRGPGLVNARSRGHLGTDCFCLPTVNHSSGNPDHEDRDRGTENFSVFYQRQFKNNLSMNQSRDWEARKKGLQNKHCRKNECFVVFLHFLDILLLKLCCDRTILSCHALSRNFQCPTCNN